MNRYKNIPQMSHLAGMKTNSFLYLPNKITNLTTGAVGTELLAQVPEVVQILRHLKLVHLVELITLI